MRDKQRLFTGNISGQLFMRLEAERKESDTC